MSDNYSQGVYAGPLTQRATDYNGHEVIGVQISDEAPDGSVFFITLDEYMQLSIAPVIAASIMPYEPAEPPAVPEIDPEDYAATRTNLERIIERMLRDSPQSTNELRTCALAMSELANVIDRQTEVCGTQAVQDPAQALDCNSSADVPSAERAADNCGSRHAARADGGGETI